MSKKRVRKPTVTQEIMQVVVEKLQKYQHDVTRKTYLRQTKQYIKFCREHFNVRTFEACKEHIQAYSNYLQSENYTASTIHTYLASVCAVFEVNLATITKPVRYVADYVRGRKTKNLDSNNDLDNPKWVYIVAFQEKVVGKVLNLTNPWRIKFSPIRVLFVILFDDFGLDGLDPCLKFFFGQEIGGIGNDIG